MWLGIFTLLTAVFIWLSLRHSPQLGLAIVVPATWFFPVWILLPIFQSEDTIVGTGIDVKVAVGAACLVLYCFMPGRTFPVRFVLADWLMLALVIVHFVSDLSNDGFRWTIPGRAYAEWYLPYVAGRIGFQSFSTALIVWRLLAGLALLLTMGVAIEAFTYQNPFEIPFGIRPHENSNPMERWGLNRAFGPTLNPIYLAVILLLLSGWVNFGLFQAMRRKANGLWTLAPLMLVAGMIGCGSRAILLCCPIVAVAFAFYMNRTWRTSIAAGSLALIALIAVSREPVIELLEKWSGEDRYADTVTIDGQSRTHSNIRSRLALFEVNRIAFQRSGLFGFGTDAVTGFPINVPLGPVETETLRKIRTVENTYALLMLRFGYLGATLFTLAGLASLLQLLWLADNTSSTSKRHFASALAASLLAVLFAQATVWMPHEIGFPLVWTFGVSSGLWLAESRPRLVDSDQSGPY